MSESAFFRLFEGLPRQGPGSDAATREALRRLGQLAATPRVMDLGCGSGRQTLVLARELQVPITAVDRHAPYLAALEAEAARQGLQQLVRPRCADFGQLEGEAEPWDLLWSEGAIYHLGWQQGLARWRPLLAEGGVMAVTEASWLTSHPPEEAQRFWRAAYPTMATVAENGRAAAAAGYQVLDTFPLPAAAWWDDYYQPLQQRMSVLRGEAAADPALAQIMAETGREIELYARHGQSYGYVFYLLRAR